MPRAPAKTKARAKGAGALPFAEVRAGVDTIVKKVFPTAKRGEPYPGFPGLIVQRPEDARRPPKEGTIRSDQIFVGLADRKQGPTLYLWYPHPTVGLGTWRKDLEAAGFKVMVGCLVFTKKQPYPFDAVERMLRAVKATDAGQI